VGNTFDSMFNRLPKIFFKTIHPSTFKKNLQGRKSLELGRLLQDIFIRNRKYVWGRTRSKDDHQLRRGRALDTQSTWMC
jgi:hypothetical protein